MADDLDGLRELRRQLVDLGILIRDPRTPSGTRKRATRALCEVSVKACDAAMTLLRQRQSVTVPEEVELV